MMSDHVLSIVSAGSAYPPGELSPSDFTGAEGTAPADFLPRSTLTRSQLAHIGTPYERLGAATISCAQLGYKAAMQALERASLTPDHLGLLIGDTVSPRETTPSEGQRIGKLLGVKLPAFDLTCGPAAFVEHIHIMNCFRPERVPDYVLAVSANTPTENVDYRTREFPFPICDAAAALILSTKHRGKLTVIDTFTAADDKLLGTYTVDTYGYLRVDARKVRSSCVPRLDELLGLAIEKNGLHSSETIFIGTLADDESMCGIARRHEIPHENCWSHQLTVQGDSAGSSAGRVIADRWDDIRPGQTIVVTSAGGGMQYGYAVLRS